MKDLYFEPTQDGKEETLSLLAKLENEIGELWKYLTKNKQDKKIYELYSFLKFCMPSNNLDFKGELDFEQIKAMLAIFTISDENDLRNIINYYRARNYGWYRGIYNFRNPCFDNLHATYQQSCKFLGEMSSPVETEEILIAIMELFLNSEYKNYAILIFSYCLTSLFASRLNDARFRLPFYLQIACDKSSFLYRFIVELVTICDVDSGLLDECNNFSKRIMCGYSYPIYVPTSSTERDVESLSKNNKDAPVLIDGFDEKKYYTNLLRQVSNIHNKKRPLGSSELFNTLPLFVCPEISATYDNVLSVDLTDMDISPEYLNVLANKKRYLASLVYSLVTGFDDVISESVPVVSYEDPFLSVLRNRANVAAQKYPHLKSESAKYIGITNYFFEAFLCVFDNLCTFSKDEPVVYANKREINLQQFIMQATSISSDSLAKIHEQYNPAPKIISAASKDAIRLAKRIEKAYKDFKVYIRLTPEDTDRDGYIFIVETLQNTTDSDITSKSTSVQRRLKDYEVFMVDLSDKTVIKLIVAKEALKNNNLITILENPSFSDTKMFMPYAVGYDAIGNMKIVDIAKIQHLLIGGTTGSGKSSAIKSLLLSLCYKKPSNVSIIIMDFLAKSGIEGLDPFEGFPLLSCPIIKDPETGYNVFMELKRYNDSVQPSLDNPHVICIVDEFQKMFEGIEDIDKKLSKNLEKTVKSLLSTARHSNIHFVFATQKPTKENMKADIGNVSSRIALYCKNPRNYNCILGEVSKADKELTGAIFGVGQMVTSFIGQKKQFIYGAYIADEKIPSFLAEIKKDYTEEAQSPFIISDEILYQPITAGMDDDATGSGNGLTTPSDGNKELAEAIMWLLPQKDTSKGKLQREFGMGFPKAQALMEQMENLFLVEKKNGKTGYQVIPDGIEDLDEEAKNILFSHGYTAEDIEKVFSAKKGSDNKA